MNPLGRAVVAATVVCGVGAGLGHAEERARRNAGPSSTSQPSHSSSAAAFPLSPKTPVAYACPQPLLSIVGATAPAGLMRQSARMQQTGGEATFVCSYTVSGTIDVKADRTGGKPTCPPERGASVVGPNPGTTTSTGQGCGQHGTAWCHGPALDYKGLHLMNGPSADGNCSYGGGSVELSATVDGTCFNGSGPETAGGHSPSGSFLCW